MQRLHDVRGPAGDTHVQQTSTDTTGGQTKTFTPPKDAVAFLINVSTTDARITLDGTAPTASNGLIVKAGQNPIYIGCATPIKVNSTAAAACIVDVLWLK